MNPVTAKFHYVYVLRSVSTGNFYTGCTSDLRARFNLHQSNQVTSTKNRGPFELLYYEAGINMSDAYQREKYLKTGMGKRYLKNRLKRALAVTG